jgi:translation initiation factor 5B
MEAAAIMESDPSLGAVLAFNVAILPDAKREAEIRGVPILKEEIIYKVLDDYRDFAKRKKEEIKRKKLEGFIRPGKFSIKLGFVFRRSKPAIVGVDVLGGAVRPKDPVMDKEGKQVGVIKELQKEKKTLTEAGSGEELAVSIEGPMVGRDIHEGDILYVDVPKEHVTALRSELRDLLTGDELSVLDETIAIKQRIDQTYGVM